MQLRDGEHRRVVNLRCCAAERTVVRIDREVCEGACENSTRSGAAARRAHGPRGKCPRQDVINAGGRWPNHFLKVDLRWWFWKGRRPVLSLKNSLELSVCNPGSLENDRSVERSSSVETLTINARTLRAGGKGQN